MSQLYYFDAFGWLTTTPNADRATEIEPPVEAEGLRANFTGVEWVLAVYTAPPPPPAQLPDPRLWWVDVGPFKDRLGMDGLAVGASTHDACKAVTETLNGRKYVDLKAAKTLSMLTLLKATAQPAANPIFPTSGPMTDAKIAVIINTPTVEEERHIKGLV